ncbi:MAG: hypothetical protein V4628_06720 [Pseudomonadota bacterium]
MKPEDTHSVPEREYEKSGMYPAEGKAFRLWALLGWLTGVMVVLAAVSALLNYILLD